MPELREASYCPYAGFELRKTRGSDLSLLVLSSRCEGPVSVSLYPDPPCSLGLCFLKSKLGTNIASFLVWRRMRVLYLYTWCFQSPGILG